MAEAATDSPASGQPSSRIVVVTEGGAHVWALVNAVSDRLGPVTVIRESPESKAALLKRRARRQGWISVLGQFGTMVLIRLGKRRFGPRADAIVAEHGLETEPRPGQVFVEVPSPNTPEFLAAIDRLKPGVVLLAGCRLLKPETLAAMPCPVINYHAGIAPKYRGMNGGYWALAAGDAENFGATIHLVDAGVDTGAVLRHVRGKPGQGDNIMLYALRLAALAREPLAEVLREALAGRIAPVATDMPSRQYYHPTVWAYLWTGFLRGVW